MKKRFLLSPFILFIIFIVGYELYVSRRGNEFLTAAHIMEGLSLSTPVKMQVIEFYNTHGDFPESNAELGLPAPASLYGRSVKSIEVSMGGKIRVNYKNAIKKDSSIILTPGIPDGYSFNNVEWVCTTETIEQSLFDKISVPCFYSPPGPLNTLIDAIIANDDIQVREALTDGIDVNDVLHGETPLLAAISRDRYAIAQQLIAAGADVNKKSLVHKGFTPLMHASRFGREKMSMLLLDHGADVDAVDHGGKTALMHAAEAGRKNIIELLLSRGANPLLVDRSGRDAVYLARKYGRRTGNDELIESAKSGFSSARPRSGQATDVTDLMHAASRGDVAKVRELISAGASIEQVDGMGAGALHYAIESRHVDAAKALIEVGINVNSADRDGNTPLLLAVKNGDNENVKILLASGTNVNMKDRYLNSPLLLAIRYGHKSIVEMLLTTDVKEFSNAALYESFVSPAPQKTLIAIQQLILDSKMAVSNDEESLADLLVKATKAGRVTIVRFLLDHRVRLDLDLDGNGLPLHIAAQQSSFEIVKLLAEHGSDINAVNKKGKTALMFAVEGRQIRLISYLLEAGADINVVDANGLTALRMAKENYSEDIVTLLRQYNKKQ